MHVLLLERGPTDGRYTRFPETSVLPRGFRKSLERSDAVGVLRTPDPKAVVNPRKLK
jgi:hypothetical protein